MLRTKVAKKVLTEAEQKHLTKDANIHSMAAMQRQVDFMKEKGLDFACDECVHIARKLGLLEWANA
jgi:hypothetical protein